jgi:hypothetical protein
MASLTLNDQIQILPTLEGNNINFNFNEATTTKISLINLLGQAISESINVEAFNQSINISLPEGYRGMYLLKIESANGVVVKKFIRE